MHAADDPDMTWATRTQSIRIADRVGYSHAFLQSTGQHTGEVPFAKGVVTDLVTIGGQTLAVVDWDTPELPERVHVANLARVDSRQFGAD
jgi:hypothetical protein